MFNSVASMKLPLDPRSASKDPAQVRSPRPRVWSRSFATGLVVALPVAVLLWVAIFALIF